MKLKSNKNTLNFLILKTSLKKKIMSGLHDQQYINENKHKLNYTKLPRPISKWCPLLQ